MGMWELEWSPCDANQCWIELWLLWNVNEFKGCLVRDSLGAKFEPTVGKEVKAATTVQGDSSNI